LLGIIIARAAPFRIDGWELIPLLAGNLARFAANADTGIGEEAQCRLLW
jgi:hypothetical protein